MVLLSLSARAWHVLLLYDQTAIFARKIIMLYNDSPFASSKDSINFTDLRKKYKRVIELLAQGVRTLKIPSWCWACSRTKTKHRNPIDKGCEIVSQLFAPLARPRRKRITIIEVYGLSRPSHGDNEIEKIALTWRKVSVYWWDCLFKYSLENMTWSRFNEVIWCVCSTDKFIPLISANLDVTEWR